MRFLKVVFGVIAGLFAFLLLVGTLAPKKPPRAVGPSADLRDDARDDLRNDAIVELSRLTQNARDVEAGADYAQRCINKGEPGKECGIQLLLAIQTSPRGRLTTEENHKAVELAAKIVANTKRVAPQLMTPADYEQRREALAKLSNITGDAQDVEAAASADQKCINDDAPREQCHQLLSLVVTLSPRLTPEQTRRATDLIGEVIIHTKQQPLHQLNLPPQTREGIFVCLDQHGGGRWLTLAALNCSDFTPASKEIVASYVESHPSPRQAGQVRKGEGAPPPQSKEGIYACIRGLPDPQATLVQSAFLSCSDASPASDAIVNSFFGENHQMTPQEVAQLRSRN